MRGIEPDDSEMAFRRGYQAGAVETFHAVEQFLDPATREGLRGWIDDVLEWRTKDGAATKDWSKVNPAIFGTLFQHSMDAKERHALGAHFTSEADIQRIVGPTIVMPWRERIDAAKNTSELFALRRELMNFRVLDPACGSGNFLYVSFRELARSDLRILTRLQKLIPREFATRARPFSIISPKQFFGLDIDPFGVELAK